MFWGKGFCFDIHVLILADASLPLGDPSLGVGLSVTQRLDSNDYCLDKDYLIISHRDSNDY